jgi:uncharacterized membrane protein YtjA (UPF0391 family)
MVHYPSSALRPVAAEGGDWGVRMESSWTDEYALPKTSPRLLALAATHRELSRWIVSLLSITAGAGAVGFTGTEPDTSGLARTLGILFLVLALATLIARGLVSRKMRSLTQHLASTGGVPQPSKHASHAAHAASQIIK